MYFCGALEQTDEDLLSGHLHKMKTDKDICAELPTAILENPATNLVMIDTSKSVTRPETICCRPGSLCLMLHVLPRPFGAGGGKLDALFHSSMDSEK